MTIVTEVIKLEDVKFDGSIYPREKPSTSIIEQYTDALAGGAVFPPIILEQGTNKLLDGYHRWKAFIKYRDEYQPELTEDASDLPEPSNTIPCEWHKIPEGVTAKLYALSLSSKHGHRPTAAERRAVAREQYTEIPGTPTRVIAELLGQNRRTVDNYIKDLKAQHEETRNSIILRLNALGWTQQEISDALQDKFPDAKGNSQQTIADVLPILENFPKSVLTELAKGHTIATVAERLGLPELYVQHVAGTRQDDLTRLTKFDIKVQPYDVWRFNSCHEKLGSKHPGRIPGEIVAHVLYFFTEQGELVIDPMAGSGTTQDTCLLMHRRCYGYDIDARHERADIIAHDILKDGWPTRTKDADMIFWDPPYFQKMDAQNIGSNGYIQGSISNLDRESYLGFFASALNELHNTVKTGTRLAFLMSDYDDNGEGVFIWHYAQILRDAGWQLKRHIQAPLSTQQVHPDIVNKFRDRKQLARLERYLLIGVK